jgi:hypothetical protein
MVEGGAPGEVANITEYLLSRYVYRDPNRFDRYIKSLSTLDLSIPIIAIKLSTELMIMLDWITLAERKSPAYLK